MGGAVTLHHLFRTALGLLYSPPFARHGLVSQFPITSEDRIGVEVLFMRVDNLCPLRTYEGE